MITYILHHPVEQQPQVAGHVKRAQIVLERDAAVLLLVPLQRIKYYIPESVDKPRLQAHIRRVILQWFPIVLHQVNGILVSQRHKIEVLFLMQLIPLVKNVVSRLTIPVEILSDNVGIPFSESTYNSLF